MADSSFCSHCEHIPLSWISGGSVPLPSVILSSSLESMSSQSHPASSPCLFKDSGLISPEKSFSVNTRMATVVSCFAQSRHSISLIYSTEFTEHLCHGRHWRYSYEQSGPVPGEKVFMLVGETENKQVNKENSQVESDIRAVEIKKAGCNEYVLRESL